MLLKNKSYIVYLLVAVLIVGIDQLTKQIAFQSLYGHPAIEVLPFLQWVMVFNRGAAFGFLGDSNGWQHFLFGGLAIAISVFIMIWLRQTYNKNTLLSSGLVCILGGAVGNLIDRLTNQYVIDFILIHYQRWYFPAFNVADIAITCGAILLIIDSLFSREEKEGGV